MSEQTAIHLSRLFFSSVVIYPFTVSKVDHVEHPGNELAVSIWHYAENIFPCH